MMRAQPGSPRQRTLPIHATTKTDAITLYRPSTLLWLCGFALLSVPMLTLIDVVTARWFASRPFPKEFTDALDLTGVFSHGSGVFLILLGLMLLAPRRRWHLPRLTTLALGGGAVATLTKMFILRPKPHSLALEISNYQSAWMWAFDWKLAQVAMFDASTRSFPSSNIATTVALTVGLWVVLPRGRWLFAAVCGGAMLQPLYRNSHFVSDVAGGVAVGLLWSYCCYHPRLLGNIFDKMAPEQNPRRMNRGDSVATSKDTSAERPDRSAAA